MKKSFLLFSFCICLCFLSCSKQTPGVETVIKNFKTNDKSKIADCFDFPYSRDYPFESINSKTEFLKVFDEVLDDEIISLVASSKPEDWAQIGWRGIALNNGVVWLNEGNFKITRININTKSYKSNLEAKILLDKETLPEKFRDFIFPVAKYEVDNCVYRIDRLKNDRYRLLIFTPNEIWFCLENGMVSSDGNGGSHYYTWNDFDGTYHIIYVDIFLNEVTYSVVPASAEFAADKMWQNVVKKLK